MDQPNIFDVSAAVTQEQPPVLFATVNGDAMTVQLRWKFQSLPAITQFNIEKSTDGGKSFASLDTVLFDTGSANFVRSSSEFTYSDASGNLGDVYTITATGSAGTSEKVTVVVPPSKAPTCCILAYVNGVIEDAVAGLELFVEPLQMWQKNATGVVGSNLQAVGVLQGRRVFYSDAKGVWTFNVRQGTKVRISIPDLNFAQDLLIPENEGPVNLRDLAPLRGSSFEGAYGKQPATSHPNLKPLDNMTTNTITRPFKLDENFLSKYRMLPEPLPGPLAKSVLWTKYIREEDTCWVDVVKRVVEGNISLDVLTPTKELNQEAEKLFETIFYGMGFPPGRGFWTGGVEGIPADARYNCWYVSIRSIDDWCWLTNMLMLGGGVGAGLRYLDALPVVSDEFADLAIACTYNHQDVSEVNPDYYPGSYTLHTVHDSREGWVEAVRVTLEAAFAGCDLAVDVSPVRHRGSLIKTFGGIASGPGPLVKLLRALWAVVRARAGKKLREIDGLDITNLIGLCIKSGNVRRSALICLGSIDDMEFRHAKSDQAKVEAWRHTSNNSGQIVSRQQLDAIDWLQLVKDNIQFGEPGFENLWLIHQTEPNVEGINPCGEIPLEDREACNLAEVFPAIVMERGGSVYEVLELITRYAVRQKLTPLSDPKADAVNRKNMRIGVGLGGLCDFAWDKALLKRWYSCVRKTADNYTDFLGVPNPVAVTTVKPSGTISLLNGSSSGMHAAFAPYYLRRIQVPSNDPLIPMLKAAGVPYEPSVYDSTGHTLVFSFPMRAAQPEYTAQNQTVRSQFERMVDVQEAWADNSVSCTIYFRKGVDDQEMADCLKEFAPRLKSCSFLAVDGHQYRQAPLEQITAEEFHFLSAVINNDVVFTKGGSMDVEACENGSCPIRLRSLP